MQAVRFCAVSKSANLLRQRMPGRSQLKITGASKSPIDKAEGFFPVLA
jgi:hypothetical protein